MISGKILAQVLDKICKSPIGQNARVQIRLPRGEFHSPDGFFDVKEINVMENMANLQALYFGGDMEAAIPLGGQVTGRIDEILTVEQVIDQTIEGFNAVVANLARDYA